MVKAYVKQLLFFFAVCLFWLSLDATGPPVEPVVDDESPWRGVGYSLLGLVSWAALLIGGFWVAHLVLGDDPLVFVGVLLLWGCLTLPLLVLAGLRLLFPHLSARLWREFDRPGPRRA